MSRLRRALVVLCTLAVVWAILVEITGGFVIHLGSIRLSSRSALNPTLLALVLAACALVLSAGRWKVSPRWLEWADPAATIALIGAGFLIYQWARATPLWLDEEMIALNVRDRSLAALAGPLWLGQSAPFGWLAVQRAAVLTLGAGERALRLLPLLFGIATLVAAVWIGRRWVSPIGAAALVLLCSFGQWLAANSFELKHYSADAFWALLLPALAAWAVDAGSGRSTGDVRRSTGDVRRSTGDVGRVATGDVRRSTGDVRRAATWWVVAAIGQWFANGAVLVTPGCAAVLLVMLAKRHGPRAVLTFMLSGCVWVASFGLHYLVAVRYALTSEFLRSYWSSALPPALSGLGGTLGWLAARFEPFALKPGGTGLWVMFWASAACGFALGSNRILSAVFAAVPLSAFAFAALRLVPLYERLSLWAVPALYLGIALFVDSAVRLAREGYARRSWVRATLAVIVAFVAFQVCSDVLVRGTDYLRSTSAVRSNHQLDDRTGVRWLMGLRQPGDALMTTRLALPAVWWYGGIPISGGNPPGSRQSDGSPILEVAYVSPGPGCQGNQLDDWLKGALKDVRRVLVYFGFRFDDVPDGFDALLLDGLGDLGVMTAFRNFAEVGRAAVFDLRARSEVEPIVSNETRIPPASRTTRLSGCVGVRVARRW